MILDLLESTLKESTDKSTQTATVLMTTSGYLVSAANTHTSGIDTNREDVHQRPAKYVYTEHSERNAIYKAARAGLELEGAIAYLTWFPCADCARALVQSGIKEVHYQQGINVEVKTDWKFGEAEEILIAGGVKISKL